jgi:hypothetical protein
VEEMTRSKIAIDFGLASLPNTFAKNGKAAGEAAVNR